MGNPLTYKGRSLTWQGRRLISYGIENKKATYTYDFNNVRTSKTATDGTTSVTSKYIYDGNNLIAEQRSVKGPDKDKSVWLYYIYGVDGIAGFNYNGVTYLYRKNVQGDITHIYRKDGNKDLVEVAHYAYDAFGNTEIVSETDKIGSLNPFRYRGYYFDIETKLYYLISRYYDPETCRFISADSIEYLDPETLGGLNLYAYCCNNPVMCVDDNGTARKWRQKLLIGLGIVAGAVLFAAAVIASAGTVAAVAGTVAATLGMSAVGVSIVGSIASLATITVGVGIAAFGLSDAIEVWSDGVNPIRDYVMGGNQTAYNYTKLGFNIAGTVATLIGAFAPKIIRSINPKTNFGGHNTPINGQTPLSRLINSRGDGYQINFYDGNGNWSFRLDAYSQLNHSNPHVHFNVPNSKGTMFGLFWLIKKLFGR